MSDTIDIDRRIELERADAARKALDEAAKRVEDQGGNDLYTRAYRKAARLIRDMASRF